MLSNTCLPFQGIYLKLQPKNAQEHQPQERTETSGGLLEWWNDPGVPLTFLVERASLEMRQVRQEFFPGQSGKVSLTLS